MSLNYLDPSMSRDEAIRHLDSSKETDVVAALISIGLNDQDTFWAQNTCIKYLESEREPVVTAAICALGHIARRHGNLNVQAVLSALQKVAYKYPSLEGIVEDTRDDIEMFTR